MIRVLIQPGSAIEAFAAIKTEWRQLFAAVECSPFLSWEWMSVWFESFGEDRIPFILKAYRAETLIGILPMFLAKREILGLRFNRLSLMGEDAGGADHLDLIAKPEDRTEAISAIFDFLQRDTSCDLIRLENLTGGSETIGLLKSQSRAKTSRLPRFTESISAVCPQIDLTSGWEFVLKQSKRASNFKRRLKQIEKIEGFDYRSRTSSDDVLAAFDRFLHLHDKRMQKYGGSELSGHPRLVAFQRRLVPELANAGLIRFDELWTKGECRSSIYALDDGSTFYYYNSGFDPEFSHLSVGLVLLGLSIKNAIERGNAVFDFLRGDETYKFDWANRISQLATVTLNRNTLPVIAYESVGAAWNGIRNFSKSALPTGFAESVGTYRRSWKRNHLPSVSENE